MKVSLIFVLLFLFSAISVGCYLKAQNIKEPTEANVNPYTWDFGQVKEGEVLKHTFILKNETQKILNINDVNTSCGCTVSQVDKKTLAPGESASIQVQFKSKGYSGPIKQYVYVHTDNLDNPIIRYIIEANVIK